MLYPQDALFCSVDMLKTVSPNNLAGTILDKVEISAEISKFRVFVSAWVRAFIRVTVCTCKLGGLLKGSFNYKNVASL